MKTITELRNYTNTKIKLLGYEHKQIFEMIDLFEKGLQEEEKRLMKEDDENRCLLDITRIETLKKILE